MRSIKHILTALLVISAAACKQDEFVIPVGSDSVPTKASVVTVAKDDSGKWRMFADDSLFYVNGAATNNYYTDVKKFGGNTIRLYSPKDESTRSIMDNAYKAGLKVYLGLGMTAAKYLAYTDEAKVAAQKETIMEYVRQYKSHPALLCWSIGNEVEASNDNNIPMWQAIGDIAAAIKELDDKHPVTCALAGVSGIKNLVKYAPDIDFISINSYYPNISNVESSVRSSGADLPYMITEYGPRGTWAMSSEPGRILPWTDYYSADSYALVEETSTEKEAIYLQLWENHIKANENKGCLGSFVFVWGYQTHGEVLNWYAMYTVDHYSYGACDAMQKCWTGEWPEARAPRIESRNDMTMNNRTAESVIRVAVGSSNTAKVTATASTEVNLRYHWIIFQESAHKSDGSMPDGIAGLFTDDSTAEVSFKAPSTPGAYRLYVFVLDDVNKKAASACIPFYAE